VNQPAVQRCDVAIVGGGMIGASLALALAASPLQVVLIEAVAASSAAQPSFDDRTTALGNGSRCVLQTLGVWEQIALRSAPICHIHVSDAGHFGFSRLHASEHQLPAFGYTVANRHMGTVLWQALTLHGRIELASPARVSEVSVAAGCVRLTVQQAGAQRLLQARLVVAADGANSLVKQAAGIASSASDYAQVALVANISTAQRAAGIAYERFTRTGPLALLPLYDGSYTLVWTLPPQRSPAMQECSDGEFCGALQRSFGWRAGQILQVGARSSYPLSLVRAEAVSAERVVLVGNAAQALHPVAAQGFNLGLRDAATLAELIAAAADPGAPALLAQFEQRRAADRRGMIAFTDRLVKLFADQRGAAVAARDLGLLLFDLSPPAKRALSRLSWGFGDSLPRLARGLPLS
jgi:2-octaprenyl-6-methoxyphenol hydroxylase